VIKTYSTTTPGAVVVDIPWNFTDSNGTTPYSNDTYSVVFAFAATNLTITNTIDRTGVRTGSGTLITYEWDDPALTGQAYLNNRADQVLKGDLYTLYHEMYKSNGRTQYTEDVVGVTREWGDCFQRDAWSADWLSLIRNFTNVLNTPTQHMKYSDLTLAHVHGNGSFMGHATNDYYLPGGFGPWELQLALYNIPPMPKWRLRKTALWSCYSGNETLATVGGRYPNWIQACGIRDGDLQIGSNMEKNAGVFLGDEIPVNDISAPGVVVADVANFMDLAWVCGKFAYPGGCDPTYSLLFAYAATVGRYQPEISYGKPVYGGYPFLPFTTKYDAEILTNNTTHIKVR
jgi:hypothetical protein